MKSFMLDEEIKNSLNTYELNSLNDANIHINTNNNFSALHELYNTLYANLLRRIEYFDSSYFINKLNAYCTKDPDDNIIKKYKDFDVKKLFELSHKVHILNTISYHIFLALYEYKRITLITDVIQEQYLLSYYKILKDEFLVSAFIKNPRKNRLNRRQSDKNFSRRKEDKIENSNIIVNANKLNPRIIANKFIKENKQNDKEDDYSSLYV